MSRTVAVLAGAAPPAPYSCLEVGPLGPRAGGDAERAESECGAPEATYGSMIGLKLLYDVVWHKSRPQHQQWSPRSLPVHHTPIRPSRRPRQQAREGQLRGKSTGPEVRLQPRPLQSWTSLMMYTSDIQEMDLVVRYHNVGSHRFHSHLGA